MPACVQARQFLQRDATESSICTPGGDAVPACVYMYKQDSCYNVTQQKAAYVGLARTVYIRIYTVYLVISKPKIPYVHRIYMVLANPKHMYTRGNAVPACVYMYKQGNCYNVTQQKAAYVHQGGMLCRPVCTCTSKTVVTM